MSDEDDNGSTLRTGTGRQQAPTSPPPPEGEEDLGADVTALLASLGAHGITVKKSPDGQYVAEVEQPKSLIPDDALGVLRSSASELDPSLVTLRNVERLIKDPESLSELSDKEIIGFSALLAMHDCGMLKIPGTVKFIENLIKLRQAKDRKRVNEFISALTDGRINSDVINALVRQNNAAPAADPADATAPKKSLWSRVRGR